MRFHLPTREAPPIRRPPIQHAPPDEMRHWFRWGVVAILVAAFAIAIAVATIPERSTPGPLDGLTLAEQAAMFEQLAGPEPGVLDGLTLDQQRIVFRTTDGLGVLGGVSLERQRSLFRIAEGATLPGILDGLTLDAQRILFRLLEPPIEAV